MPNKVICSTIGIRHPVPVCGSRKCQVWQPSSGGRVFVIAIIVVAPYHTDYYGSCCKEPECVSACASACALRIAV